MVLTGLRVSADRAAEFVRGPWRCSGSGEPGDRGTPDPSIRRRSPPHANGRQRELGTRHRAPDRIEHFLGVLKAFPPGPQSPEGLVSPRTWASRARRARPGRPVTEHRPHRIVRGRGVLLDTWAWASPFIDDMQDVQAGGRVALCAATHELSQTRDR